MNNVDDNGTNEEDKWVGLPDPYDRLLTLSQVRRCRPWR